eukprot:354195-Chlamydomonas_euryale.AAC.3
MAPEFARGGGRPPRNEPSKQGPGPEQLPLEVNWVAEGKVWKHVFIQTVYEVVGAPLHFGDSKTQVRTNVWITAQPNVLLLSTSDSSCADRLILCRELYPVPTGLSCAAIGRSLSGVATGQAHSHDP